MLVDNPFKINYNELGMLQQKEYDALKEKISGQIARVPESKWNVVSEYEFKNRVMSVFNRVANSLSRTLGPYGSTTIIEKYGEMHITKDGWQVLKSIQFDDMIDNNILMMLLRISQQVVIKVGDGSTSSVIAANTILKHLTESRKGALKGIRSKELISHLNECVDIISSTILKNAKKINKDTYDEIYKIAYISTNGDEVISNMITDIYKKTNNPAIEFTLSKTNETEYEIIDGYTGNITYLDKIYATDETGACVIKNPLFLMFNYKIDTDALELIAKALEKAIDEKRRLVVIAPHYDKQLLDYIRKNTMVEYKATGTTNVVYTKVNLVNNITHDMYNDFAIMTGGEIITEASLNDETLMDDIVDIYLGETSTASIESKSTFISGFINRNETMYKKIVDDATSKYNETQEDYINKSIIDTKLNEMKQRISKLTGSVGVIKVGGYSSLEKKANFDLVEDAVKACESAFLYGYNIGGSMTIPWTIDNICSKIEGTDTTAEIFDVIKEAFNDVFRTIYFNKYMDDCNIDENNLNNIINSMVTSESPVCYDLITEKMSYDIINSCITDIEILRAAVSIVSLLLSSNQYISINTRE